MMMYIVELWMESGIIDDIQFSKSIFRVGILVISPGYTYLRTVDNFNKLTMKFLPCLLTISVCWNFFQPVKGWD